MRFSWRNLLINSLMVIVSVTLTMRVGEYYFRKYEPQERRTIMNYLLARVNREPSAPHLFQYDPVLGWGGKPNAMGEFHNDEFSIKVRNNKEGMRYPEIGPKKGFRVAAIGDSFLWGYGVGEKKRVTNRIEQDLGIEILNFGQHGYGTLQYYLIIDQVIAFKPDLVVMFFCLENDFGDSVVNFRYRAYKPYAELQNGRLVISGYPIPNRYDLAEHMPSFITSTAMGRYIYTYYYTALSYISPKLWPPLHGLDMFMGNSDQSAFRNMESQRLAEVISINTILLRQIKTKLDKAGIPLVIMPVPMKPYPRTKEYNDKVFGALERATRRLDVTLIHDLDDFRTEDYFSTIPHWNVHGHETAAKVLKPVIRQYQKDAK